MRAFVSPPLASREIDFFWKLQKKTRMGKKTRRKNAPYFFLAYTEPRAFLPHKCLPNMRRRSFLPFIFFGASQGAVLERMRLSAWSYFFKCVWSGNFSSCQQKNTWPDVSFFKKNVLLLTWETGVRMADFQNLHKNIVFLCLLVIAGLWKFKGL